MPALHGGGISRPEQESGSFPAAGGRAVELHPVVWRLGRISKLKMEIRKALLETSRANKLVLEKSHPEAGNAAEKRLPISARPAL